jgi:hypothetical protein
VRTVPRALPSGLPLSKDVKRMVFIELARVSEIPAPHKFDRSTSGNFRSIDFPARLDIRILTSSKQLVCKIIKESHHWTSNWCRSEGMLRKALHELGGKVHLNLETFGIWTSNFNNSQFFKGSMCQTLCWEPLDVIFLNQNQIEILPKIPLDPISSKNNVVFKTTVKWMPKRNISNAATHKA